MMQTTSSPFGNLQHPAGNTSIVDVTSTPLGDSDESHFLGVVKVIACTFIIVMAVGGNLLVILSVCRYHNLRSRANTFIVSLAFADLLVAVLVMPFSASQEIAQRWLFNRLTCDVFNANDVLFSTASILNLCCISMDRYIAITDPFNYSVRMSKRKIIIILAVVWMASILVSHLPIHLKLYATDATLDDRECSFQVNVYYGIVSSVVSFWFPALVMLFTYKQIFSEAQRQVRQIEALRPKSPPSPNIALAEIGRKVKDGAQDGVEDSPAGSNKSLNSNVYVCPRLSVSSNHLTVSVGGRSKRSKTNSPKIVAVDEELPTPRKPTQANFKRSFTNLFQADAKSQSAGSSENRRRLKREHKAAKTLGIIMGVFIGCWLSFFTWYLTSSICQESCHTPKVVVSLLFWIGYTNSALNPIIYACFNREFRGAFRRQLCHHGRWTSTGRNLEVVVGSDKNNWRWSNDLSSNKKEEV